MDSSLVLEVSVFRWFKRNYLGNSASLIRFMFLKSRLSLEALGLKIEDLGRLDCEAKLFYDLSKIISSASSFLRISMDLLYFMPRLGLFTFTFTLAFAFPFSFPFPFPLPFSFWFSFFFFECYFFAFLVCLPTFFSSFWLWLSRSSIDRLGTNLEGGMRDGSTSMFNTVTILYGLRSTSE